jgi:hypothetical protein
MFKAGDKVKCIGLGVYTGEFLRLGSIYEVVSSIAFPGSNTEWLTIGNTHKIIGSYPSSQFELVSESPNHDLTWIVETFTLEQGGIQGNPIPATPHKCKCVFRDLLMNGCKCGGV